MTRHESDMIRVLRVLCIFFMMSVHVPPGSDPSLVNVGGLAWLGFLWKDVLGRASVAALSLVSGYLLIGSARDRSLATTIKRRWSVLIVPMLFWNILFAFLVLCAGGLGHEGSAFRILDEATPAALVNLLTGFSGPTLNLSLVFLRDMFVCSVVILLVWQWLRRWPFLGIFLAFVLALFDPLDPVVMRPAILFFMVLGAIARDRGITLSRLAEARHSLPATLACILSMALLSGMRGAGGGSEQWLAALDNLMLRTALIFLCLLLVDYLARRSVGKLIGMASDSIFLVYLSHVPVISLAWLIWKPTIGTAMAPGYVVFFLLSPVLALAFGVVLGRALNMAPRPLRLLAAGRDRG